MLSILKKYGREKQQHSETPPIDPLTSLLDNVSRKVKREMQEATGASSADTRDLINALTAPEVDLKKVKEVTDEYEELVDIWKLLFEYQWEEIYRLFAKIEIDNTIIAFYESLIPDFAALVDETSLDVDYEYEIWFWLYYDLNEILASEELVEIIQGVLSPSMSSDVRPLTRFPFFTFFLASTLPYFVMELISLDYPDYVFLTGRNLDVDAKLAAEHDAVGILSAILAKGYKIDYYGVNVATIAARYNSVGILRYLLSNAEEKEELVGNLDVVVRLAAEANAVDVLDYILNDFGFYPKPDQRHGVRVGALDAGALDAIELLMSLEQQKTSSAVKEWLSKAAKYDVDVFRTVLNMAGARPRMNGDSILETAAVNLRDENVAILLEERPLLLTLRVDDAFWAFRRAPMPKRGIPSDKMLKGISCALFLRRVFCRRRRSTKR